MRYTEDKPMILRKISLRTKLVNAPENWLSICLFKSKMGLPQNLRVTYKKSLCAAGLKISGFGVKGTWNSPGDWGNRRIRAAIGGINELRNGRIGGRKAD